MSELVIRDAAADDADAVLAIYNQAVAETTAVWNETPSDLAGRAAWIAARQGAGYPVLIAEKARRVVGYASFGDFRPFDGYRHTVESSVYVAPDAHRQGVGRALLEALIRRARAMDKHAVVAGIEAGNLASLRLHATAGFVEVGRLPQVGRKFGRWLDLVFMQRLVNDARAEP